MADLGHWHLCPRKQDEILYLNLGPMQGPLVIYRVHNDGPCAVLVGSAILLDPQTDCDVSGARIDVRLAGSPRCHSGAVTGDDCPEASGTYELMCCQPPPQVGTPAALVEA